MKKKIALGLCTALILIFTFSYFYLSSELPRSFSLIRGSETTISLGLPFNIYVRGEQGLEINGRSVKDSLFRVSSGSPLRIKSEKVGRISLDLKFLGIIPFRTITVNVFPDISVYPGGQAIGVLLESKGVMVIGKSFVEADDGHRYYPGREAGIEVGDIILKINGREVNKGKLLSELIQETAADGKAVELLLKNRNGEERTAAVKPVKSKDNLYMIGLYVEDQVAGVGTLTFYEPTRGEFGALGHEVMELSSQIRVNLLNGSIVQARISGIHTGSKGLPGEKLGTFFHSDEKSILGQIKQNNRFGIYGVLKRFPDNPYFQEPIPVAPISEVRQGPAVIYTVVEGGKIEEFKINIDRVYQQAFEQDKGLIITITDPRLQESTGGIIQGMSGSPIVQNNKLVGAVTHVFVNDPRRGYGVFAQWMLMQTAIYQERSESERERTRSYELPA